MSLEEFVIEQLNIRKIPLTSQARYGKSVVEAIINGYRKAGWSPGGWSSFTKKYFPDKPKNEYIRTYLLHASRKRLCIECELVLDLDYFHVHTGRKSGTQSICASCDNRSARIRSAKRYAGKIDRTPRWANLEKIKEFYSNCPEGYHVDHIIPLQGKLVSGLHVDNNLQYLTAKENLTKGNRFSS